MLLVATDVCADGVLPRDQRYMAAVMDGGDRSCCPRDRRSHVRG